METTVYTLSIASVFVGLMAAAVGLHRSHEGRALEVRLVAAGEERLARPADLVDA